MILLIGCLLELVVAVEIRHIALPLGVGLDLPVTKRIGAFHFEDAKSSCGVRVTEIESSGRGTHSAVLKHPDPSWFHHTSGHVLICIDRHRLVSIPAVLFTNLASLFLRWISAPPFTPVIIELLTSK